MALQNKQAARGEFLARLLGRADNVGLGGNANLVRGNLPNISKTLLASAADRLKLTVPPSRADMAIRAPGLFSASHSHYAEPPTARIDQTVGLIRALKNKVPKQEAENRATISGGAALQRILGKQSSHMATFQKMLQVKYGQSYITQDDMLSGGAGALAAGGLAHKLQSMQLDTIRAANPHVKQLMSHGGMMQTTDRPAMDALRLSLRRGPQSLIAAALGIPLGMMVGRGAKEMSREGLVPSMGPGMEHYASATFKAAFEKRAAELGIPQAVLKKYAEEEAPEKKDDKKPEPKKESKPKEFTKAHIQPSMLTRLTGAGLGAQLGGTAGGIAGSVASRSMGASPKNQGRAALISALLGAAGGAFGGYRVMGPLGRQSLTAPIQ